jgi:hypothetical protein
LRAPVSSSAIVMAFSRVRKICMKPESNPMKWQARPMLSRLLCRRSTSPAIDRMNWARSGMVRPRALSIALE